MQHNQVFVIQVSSEASSTKAPLALPSPAGAPESAVLPSEVKYSASLVKGLGLAHLFLGGVIFLLGVLGTWIEPETCWAGAGVWTGLAALLCGFSGVVAHYFWYKNFSIKAFLVTSVVCVVLSVLAIILSIYAIVNRHKHFQFLLENNDEHSWFQPYDLNKEHRLTVNISANLLVGFFLEVGLALWSSRVGWRGVQTPEFSASKRDGEAVDPPGVTPLPPRPNQQVPLAALYQLLQTHPEMLNNKSVEGGLPPPWISSGISDHPTHHSMDYHERVNRFLSHAIEDQNPCLSRPLSALLTETRDTSSTATSSGGRCSPADTLPLPAPTDQGSSGHKVEIVEREMRERHSSIDRKPKQTEAHVKRDPSTERKVKQTHIDKLPNGQTGNERKIKETHTDTLSNGGTKTSRKTKQTQPDKAPTEQPNTKRRIKETHADSSQHKPYTNETRVKEIYEDTDEDSAVSIQKVKVTHVDRLPNGPPTSDRKMKETHIDTVTNRDTSSERKRRDTHTHALADREHSSERKRKDPHTQMADREHSSERKGKKTPTHTRTDREHSTERRGKETHTNTLTDREHSSERRKDTQPDPSNKNTETTKKVKKRHSDTASTSNVKVTHVDTLSNYDSDSMNKVKITHVDTLSSVESGSSGAGKVKDTPSDTMRRRRGSDHKPKAPAPKIRKSESFKADKSSTRDEFMNSVTITIKKDSKDDKSEVQSDITPVVCKVEKVNINKEDVTKPASEITDPNVQRKKTEKAEKHKKKKTKRSAESDEQETKANVEEINVALTENTNTSRSEKEERKARKERKEKRKKESKGDEEKSKDATKSSDLVTLASNLAPPCEFQDT